MRLPNAASAVVPREKITGYLLSTTHRDGRHKAAFSLPFGFSAEAWPILAAALLRHAAENEVTKVEDPPFGTRYVVEGIMRVMIKELDTVVLMADVPAYDLKRGDLGTVVMVHTAGGYEVECMTLDGQTLAVASLDPDEVRPVGRGEIAQARSVQVG